MARSELQRLIADAPRALTHILDPARGPVQAPVRAEIFGMQGFAQHGHKLGETHRSAKANTRVATFFPRLRNNVDVLREAHRYIGMQAGSGYDISPAAEWLLDNFHLIEAQFTQIHEGLPRSYFRALPILLDESLAGLPRVYGVAWAFVAHTDSAFDEDLLIQFLQAYQEHSELKLGELWALPTTLRVVLIENLRCLAERVASHKAARELANLCCDRIDSYPVEVLDQVLALLNQRGVGRVFLAQMAQRLQDRRAMADARYPPLYHDWLQEVIPDLAAVQAEQSADQAANNLSVSNAVTSLRAIGDADWPEIIARISALMRLMVSSPVFESEDVSTRDQTLHGIERLAQDCGRSEVSVGQTLLDLMHVGDGADRVNTVASHWLYGSGRPELLRALDLHERALLRGIAFVRRVALPVYLGSLVLGSAGLVAWMLLRHGGALPDSGTPAWRVLAFAVLMLLPASETVVAVVNRLISESIRPRHLPRLALVHGIPPEHRALVAVPAMLSDAASICALAHRLQLHYLANPEPQAQFALLTDWTDADTQCVASDQELLDLARQAIRDLNARHPRDNELAGGAPRFIVLHRVRTYCDTEQRWIGWERKRGKLEQLVIALAEGTHEPFLDLGDESRLAADTRYVVTLDSDTQLPPGRLRELVGVAAHPHNQPRLDDSGHRMVSGYGILAPRVAVPLPAEERLTLYHWLFAGQCGIDPYSAATSEVYQDLFREGSFSGKGLLNVHALHAVLCRRLPEGQVLSHDLLEGSIVRCATVTDITLIEDAPVHSDVAAQRLHRWTRGDWQLLPFLWHPARYGLRAIHWWKMFDNLRRSLVPPMSLVLLVLALGGAGPSPWAVLALVLAAFSAGPVLGAFAGMAPSRYGVARLHFYQQACADMLRALCGGLWHLAQLLQQAWMSTDAVLRALYRMGVSRRHLLEWTTAAAAQAQAQTAFLAVLRRHWKEPAIALLLYAALRDTPTPALTLSLCLLWGASPLWTWWASRAPAARTDIVLPPSDQAYLEGIARDTWRFFERCVNASDNHLPPDNLQTTPHDMVAHRTSPTNIGLYLLSTACARQFGWIGTQELLARLEATLATLNRLQRHRGHFLNWYDTQSCAPLLPMYVSTVDSGNLSGHLLAVSQALLELAQAPYDDQAAQRAVRASGQRLTQRLSDLTRLAPTLLHHPALAHLLALPDPLASCQASPAEFDRLLHDAADELAALWPENADPDAADRPMAGEELGWLLADHLSTLRSIWRDLQAQSSAPPHALAPPAKEAASQRLRTLAEALERMAWETEFGFLYHRRRRLLHIGYRVAEQQLDAGFYDLLASESRLTSLLAVAKGDVPVRHWASLGRPFFAVGLDACLRSWSGSMFEYLMPRMVLDEPQGSVLRESCRAALHEQVAFAQAHGVPWGISESAYAGSDHTLAYQYAPQGVPRLALRRTPPDELVIAPYATALAAQIAPRFAQANLRALDDLGARKRYGFIEALDFSAARQSNNERFTPVVTYMAHHQGMSIVALANVLLDNVVQRWGMANAHIQAVDSLLHERSPREISMPYARQAESLQRVPERRRTAGLQRELMPGATALEPTHLLSNGHYSVSLRANGAGWSRWNQTGVTRWRDDALRDAHGSFLYLRALQSPGDAVPARLASITQHPAPDPAAQYLSSFHADRVYFEASWPEVQAHTTVWVSPEDDIEFRQVELRNLSERVLDLELISVFEVTLADPRADEAHPAFSNLFVRAEWQPSQQALLFSRLPRLPTEQGLLAAHFLTDSDPQVVALRCQTDRQRWLGRNRDVSQPRAALLALPEAGSTVPLRLDTGLDPVCALAVHVRIAPAAKAQLTFATAVSSSSGSGSATLAAVIDKYRQRSHVQRASLMSATLAGIRLRGLRISPESLAAIQTLTTALVLNLTRPQGVALHPGPDAATPCDRRLLWRFGISGDRPIVLVSVDLKQSLGLVRALAQGLTLWAWGGVACDLVVLNAEPASYLMPLQNEVAALRERHVADCAAQGGPTVTGLHMLRVGEVSTDELATLQALARVWFHADGRPLLHHVQEWAALHEQAFAQRSAVASWPVTIATGTAVPVAPVGEFATGTAEFSFDVNVRERPTRPWINVLSNPAFGAQISEAGAGFSWALNSRLNQLTVWSNDPVADPPSEWFLLQDRKTREAWSVAPSAWGDEHVPYRVTHGQGYSVIHHRREDLEVSATWCVDAHNSVKQVHLVLTNHGDSALALRVIGIAEWVMGASRSDRATAHTAPYRQPLPTAKLTALLCTQRERAAGFGDGTAFFGLVGEPQDAEDWTCDRRECFDTRGRLVLPERWRQRSGDGLDPCAVVATGVTVPAGGTLERVFLLGFASSPDAARALAAQAATVPPLQRLRQVRATWDRLLGATTVQTPDPLFDAMVNRWLLYQTVACRMWAKAGFYQAGGATGFRDQLQDAMALAWAAPAMLRQQIVLCASRQFVEGDVQHWWHAPSGAGVRTHFSDDLLWLPYATSHYLHATGDGALLDQSVPFLEGASIPNGAEDAYYTPATSEAQAPVYEHCARAIDRSLRVGAHGLPLMGTGDWNDGMNRVGHEGRGESVWLGWFLCRLVADFVPLARARGDEARALRWQEALQGWRSALLDAAWDGKWFKRAFFDDGQALGSHDNAEARIDLIAQAWAVLSRAAPPALQHLALTAVESHLVDPEAGLIRLLDPPLERATPSAGYIQAYPPGVRENGGQYSHAGVWALMAQAALATTPLANARDHVDHAYRYFTYLSPAHRASHSVRGAAYGIEPYVMAGDVYSQPPYVGRGGWSWYTGAAAWLHRAAIESIFGLRQGAQDLSFMPCLPSHWQQAELTLSRDGHTLRFILIRATAQPALAATAQWGARLLRPGELLRWTKPTAHSCFVVPLLEAPVDTSALQGATDTLATLPEF